MKIFILIILACSVASLSQTVTSGQTVVTASEVNGTWESKSGAFKVRALGNQKLRVKFLGFYDYVSQTGRMVNTGEGEGIAFIEGDTAIFKPDGAEEECRITMKFTGGKLFVTQEGICGFGLNVTAAGTYRKVANISLLEMQVGDPSRSEWREKNRTEGPGRSLGEQARIRLRRTLNLPGGRPGIPRHNTVAFGGGRMSSARFIVSI